MMIEHAPDMSAQVTFGHALIPSLDDYDPCALLRIPSDMMRQGSSTSLFQA